MPNGLVVKFGRRGRTYTGKDFRGMSDYNLLNKVIVFAASLPWKDEKSRQDTFTMLGMVGRWIKEREKDEPREERSAAA